MQDLDSDYSRTSFNLSLNKPVLAPNLLAICCEGHQGTVRNLPAATPVACVLGQVRELFLLRQGPVLGKVSLLRLWAFQLKHAFIFGMRPCIQNKASLGIYNLLSYHLI